MTLEQELAIHRLEQFLLRRTDDYRGLIVNKDLRQRLMRDLEDFLIQKEYKFTFEQDYYVCSWGKVSFLIDPQDGIMTLDIFCEKEVNGEQG